MNATGFMMMIDQSLSNVALWEDPEGDGEVSISTVWK